MILDMANTNPEGYTDTSLFVPKNAVSGQANYTDANIWEIQVRDFSNNITQSKYKGKYLAFTETGLKENGIPVGLDYLKELGITHVHLMPSFDIASVDESRNDQFNWGYDPLNYNAPEGSYSTNASDGAVRVKEFKAMVQALHKAGIGVIMDVVYNHTSGLDSNFQKIVPYYYYRFKNNGSASNGSGCGNETASNRTMFGKFMIDSVTHWMKDYNVDGFRFDLMALHDYDTMKDLEKAVHAINPNAILYGTGAKADMASKIMFGVLGGTYNTALGVASGTSYWGSAGNPTQMVTYASAHDNYTLYDKLLIAYPGNNNKDGRLARNRLTVAISCYVFVKK